MAGRRLFKRSTDENGEELAAGAPLGGTHTEAMQRLQAVSYTHLTLPTTPYV